MLTYPDINPVALQLGTLQIHWYGITYLVGFLGAYLLCVYRGPRQAGSWNKEQVADLLFYAAMGIIFGGRIGFVLFYQPSTVLTDPLSLLKFWVMGRSFHGGLLGVLLAVLLYAKLQRRRFLAITDFIAPVVPIGLGLGRIGNFINGELCGRVTDLPWGMVFPFIDARPRHPSQLYEFALEGVLLFIILWRYAAKPRQGGAVSGAFMLCYGVFRFLVEFVREPDLSHGAVAFNWLTMGQLLSLPMVLIGLYLMFNKARAILCNNI